MGQKKNGTEKIHRGREKFDTRPGEKRMPALELNEKKEGRKINEN